jgi:aspartate/tyrosine/aromatic aminotransferase
LLVELPIAVPDPLWQIVADSRANTQPKKIELVVGVYRDDDGHVPLFRAVHEAELVMAEAARSRPYLGLSGDYEFTRAIARLVLPSVPHENMVEFQTVAGTGALRIIAELIHVAHPSARVLVGSPSYVNHVPIIRAAGLEVVDYRHVDAAGRVDLAAILDAIDVARRGDVILLQGCCHNPTGTDLSPEQWQQIAEHLQRKGVLPFIDQAYYGLGRGLDPDLEGTRLVVAAVPEAFVAVSGSKAFGLYSERVGCALVISQSGSDLTAIRTTLENISRTSYSQPPEHGARLVSTILGDHRLRALWREELASMQRRLSALRSTFTERLRDHGFAPEAADAVGEQHGMFSMLPLTAAQMLALRTNHSVYGTNDGRINLAGLPVGRIDDLATAVVAVSTRSPTKV